MNEIKPAPKRTPTSILQKRTDRAEVKELIQMILDSPIRRAPITDVDGVRDIASFKGMNTDVKTRILLQIATDAMKGDRQAAEFIFKFGGLEPVKESKVTVETPTFIDDLGGEVINAVVAEEVKETVIESGDTTVALPVYVDDVEAGNITPEEIGAKFNERTSES